MDCANLGNTAESSVYQQTQRQEAPLDAPASFQSTSVLSSRVPLGGRPNSGLEYPTPGFMPRQNIEPNVALKKKLNELLSHRSLDEIKATLPFKRCESKASFKNYASDQ